MMRFYPFGRDEINARCVNLLATLTSNTTSMSNDVIAAGTGTNVVPRPERDIVLLPNYHLVSSQDVRDMF